MAPRSADQTVAERGPLSRRNLEGGASSVDILIATPGRLMDHLKSTPGFSLQHLRYLVRSVEQLLRGYKATDGPALAQVVDEADRLLTQSFHDWLPTVLSALKPTFDAASLRDEDEPVAIQRGRHSRLSKEPIEMQADALAPSWWDAEGRIGRQLPSDIDERCLGSVCCPLAGSYRTEFADECWRLMQCQKLLFSATLSRDPAKIDALHLYRPVYISVEDALDPHAEDEGLDNENKFTFPAELSEHMIISPASHKPLYLFHLLHTLSISSALCFTRSVEAAARLAKLVEFFEEARVANGIEGKKVVVRAFSSELALSERNKVLREFRKGEIQMCVLFAMLRRSSKRPPLTLPSQADLLGSDRARYRHPERLARHQLRHPCGHA